MVVQLINIMIAAVKIRAVQQYIAIFIGAFCNNNNNSIGRCNNNTIIQYNIIVLQYIVLQYNSTRQNSQIHTSKGRLQVQILVNVSGNVAQIR